MAPALTRAPPKALAAQLFRHDCGFNVWSVRLHDPYGDDENGQKLIFGGESVSVIVMDLASREVEMVLPVEDGYVQVCDATLLACRPHPRHDHAPVINLLLWWWWIWQAVAAAEFGICWSMRGETVMMGKGGNHFGWQDKPSFAFCTELIAALMSAEAQLLMCLRILIKKHPAIVNLVSPTDGSSLLHFVLKNCRHMTSVIGLLLQAPSENVRIGLPPDFTGATALHSVVDLEVGWRPLHLIQQAIVTGQMVLAPASVKSFSDCVYQSA